MWVGIVVTNTAGILESPAWGGRRDLCGLWEEEDGTRGEDDDSGAPYRRRNE